MTWIDKAWDAAGDAIRDADPTSNTSYVGKKLGTGGTRLVRQAIASSAVSVTGGAAALDKDVRHDAIDAYATGAKVGAQAAGLPPGTVPGASPASYYSGGGAPPPSSPGAVYVDTAHPGQTTVLQVGGEQGAQFEGFFAWLLRILRTLFGA